MWNICTQLTTDDATHPDSGDSVRRRSDVANELTTGRSHDNEYDDHYNFLRFCRSYRTQALQRTRSETKILYGHKTLLQVE